MKKLQKGQRVVKVLAIRGVETATIETVEKVSQMGVVKLAGSSLCFDATTRREIDQSPAFAGVATCRLVDFDDGELRRWGLDPKDEGGR